MTRQSSSSSRARSVKPRTAGGALGGILGAIAMSIIAGVLVTAAVTPVVALSGTATNSVIGIFESLPNHLNPGRLAEPSTLYAKGGDGKYKKLAVFYDQDRETVKWNDIPQYVKDAAVAEEDPRFYTHGGVDVLASSRALLQNAAGQDLSGASTITMQYVRNVRIQEALAVPDKEAQDKAYEDAMEQTMDRKLQEMRYAIAIEKKYPKDDILLGYLNIALFGRQIYGIESAAHYYYNKSAKDLSLAESASLVAIVNNPVRFQLDIPENIPANTERRNKILDSMLRHGKITEAEHAEAVATEVTPDITIREAGCFLAEKKYGVGHFCDFVQRYIKADPNFGKDEGEREFNFSRGGYKIYTTIDLDMQKAGLQAMHNTVPSKMDGIKVGGANVSVEVGTGRILSMLQNRPFSIEEAWIKKHPEYTGINYNTDFEFGGSSGFQVASTFKPVTLAEWIRTGHSVRDIVNVNPRTVDESSIQAKCMPDGVYGFGSFKFDNDNNGTRGNRPVLTAIANSVNGGLVSMQQKMDLCDTFDTAKKLGIHRASVQTNNQVANFGTTDLTLVPSNVYGGIDEIAPMTMATAYAAFAGDGTVCTPVPIDKIKDSDGNPVEFTKSKCTEGIDAEVAAGVAYALNYTVTNGLARHAASAYGVPHLAKTGTSDDVIDNWTVGASTKVANATWVGNSDPICQNPKDPSTCGRVSTQGFGGLMYADQSIWPAVMNVADAKYGGEAFREPSPDALKQNTAKVPDVTGKSFEEASRLLTAAGFNVTDGGEKKSSLPAGQIVSSDPAGGTEVPLGSGVEIFKSNGKAMKMPGGLVGQSGKAAEDALDSAGFSNVKFVCEAGGSPDPSKHTVVSSKPASGADANPDGTIRLTLNCKA